MTKNMNKNVEKPRERLTVGQETCASTLQMHIDRYIFAAQFAEGKIILDVACGIGYGSESLIKKRAKMVTGGDYSQEAIGQARLHHQKDRLHFLCLDAQQMPFTNNSFDMIVSFETIEHLERYEHFLRECNRILKDNGMFICSTPNREGRFGYKNPFHLREFSPEELYHLLAKYFVGVKLYGQGFLKKSDMVKGKSIKALRPIIRFVPQPVKHFLQRSIVRGHWLPIEITPYHERELDQWREHTPPVPLTRDSPLAVSLTAVARNQAKGFK